MRQRGNDDIIKCPACRSQREEKVISSIIIDGYNLIGIDHGDLAAQREGLIRMLAEYRRIKGHDITVVFDGWKSGSRVEERLNSGGVKVVYSRLGEKADAVIARIICTEKKEWVVVSSDREIVLKAWACGSVPVSSEKFRAIVEGAGRVVAGEYEPLEEEEGNVTRKGRSRTPSRKEKALLRVLKKL